MSGTNKILTAKSEQNFYILQITGSVTATVENYYLYINGGSGALNVSGTLTIASGNSFFIWNSGGTLTLTGTLNGAGRLSFRYGGQCPSQ